MKQLLGSDSSICDTTLHMGGLLSTFLHIYFTFNNGIPKLQQYLYDHFSSIHQKKITFHQKKNTTMVITI